ncbi:MAG TPA: PH domain-containing protein [Candidatus Absconditabacterales bacterium]|nr:PH domain-containing protein [Candidatus Absconditabacterales bacterium]
MKKYIQVEEIFHVIGHNSSVFIILTMRTLIFLLVLYVLFFVSDKYILWQYLPRFFGVLGIGFFIKYIVDFLNIYLDGLILSEGGITMFMREGLFEYKTDFFERDKIESVSHNQNSFWDKLFGKGDVIIKLEHGIEYPFENINAPQKQTEKILKYKAQFSLDNPVDASTSINDEKMAIIAEALSEVVKEYMDKKSSEETENDEY